MTMMPTPSGMTGGAMPQMPSPEEIEQAKLIAEAVSWEEIEPILRTDERRNYNIDIETDSTIFEDAEAEKQQRIEVMGAMTTWMERALPAIQANRSLTPIFKELTMFTLGAFKIGRTLEETFEDAFDQIQDAPEQPNPEQMKIEMETKAKQAEIAMKQKEGQDKIAFEREKFGLEREKMGMELQYKREEIGLKREEMQANQQINREKSQFERESAQREQEFKGQEIAVKQEESNFKRYDMDERRKADIQDKEMRRDTEVAVLQRRANSSADVLDEKAFDVRRSELEQNVSQQLQQLAAQFAQSMNELSQNQVQIVQALTDIKGNQDEVTEAVTAVVSHMTAPRKVRRDDKGRAIGVEVGQAQGGDIRQMLASLTSGGRQLARDKMGRVEGF